MTAVTGAREVDTAVVTSRRNHAAGSLPAPAGSLTSPGGRKDGACSASGQIPQTVVSVTDLAFHVGGGASLIHPYFSVQWRVPGGYGKTGEPVEKPR